MAKARDIPDLLPADSFRAAAAKVVAVRAQELFEHSENVLNTQDIERVHDMRVASRRLRAVLEIFAPCFPRKQHRGVLRDVKAVADALGERRDPDVHIAALRRIAEAVPPAERTGVEQLTASFAGEQAEGNRTVALALEEIERDDLRGRLERLAAEAGAPEP